MNQTFSFERYTQLLKHQLYKDATAYKIAIAVAVFVVAFMYWWAIRWEDFERGPIFFFIVIVCPIFSFSSFEILNRKNKKKMFYFSLPVSSLERVAVYFTFTMIIAPIFMLALFTVSDFVALHLYNYINDASEVIFFKTHYLSRFFTEDLILFLGLMSWSIIMCLFVLFGKEKQNILFFIVLPTLFLLNRFVFQLSFIAIINACAILLPVFWILMFYAIKRKEV